MAAQYRLSTLTECFPLPHNFISPSAPVSSRLLLLIRDYFRRNHFYSLASVSHRRLLSGFSPLAAKEYQRPACFSI